MFADIKQNTLCWKHERIIESSVMSTGDIALIYETQR